MKYVGEEHIKHLLDILLANYEGVHEDWGGTKIFSITLKWDYIQRTYELSMSGYIEAILNRFHHPRPIKPELAPPTGTPPDLSARPTTKPPPQTTTPPNLTPPASSVYNAS